MGKIKGHSLIKEVSGSIGKDMYLRKSGGDTIISRKGIARKSSKLQQANRQRFSQASLYARGISVKPELSRAYKIIGMIEGISAKSAAISDYLNQPEIEFIDTENYKGNIGDRLYILDQYLLKLTKVEVVISGSDGTLIEKGNAVPWELHWQYFCTVPNVMLHGTQIRVTAFDRLRRRIEKVVVINRLPFTGFKLPD